MISAAGSVGERPENDAQFPPAVPSMAGGGSFSSSTTLVSDRGYTATENSINTLTQRRVERMHSGKSRRDHGRHPSHSRHHKEELKTVSEYALHVLFTSVSH